MSAGLYAGLTMQQGYEADGVTAANLAAVKVRGSSASPATTEPTLEFQTRTYAGTGALTTRFVYDTSNASLRPDVDVAQDLGMDPFQWKSIRLGPNGVKVSGTKVLGEQGAAVADATDAATAITQLNALLARCRAHGLIA